MSLRARRVPASPNASEECSILSRAPRFQSRRFVAALLLLGVALAVDPRAALARTIDPDPDELLCSLPPQDLKRWRAALPNQKGLGILDGEEQFRFNPVGLPENFVVSNFQLMVAVEALLKRRQLSIFAFNGLDLDGCAIGVVNDGKLSSREATIEVPEEASDRLIEFLSQRSTSIENIELAQPANYTIKLNKKKTKLRVKAVFILSAEQDGVPLEGRYKIDLKGRYRARKN